MLDFDDVVARIGKGEFEDFAVKWSNDTISWPNEYLLKEVSTGYSNRGRRAGVLVSSKPGVRKSGRKAKPTK